MTQNLQKLYYKMLILNAAHDFAFTQRTNSFNSYFQASSLTFWSIINRVMSAAVMSGELTQQISGSVSPSEHAAKCAPNSASAVCINDRWCCNLIRHLGPLSHWRISGVCMQPTIRRADVYMPSHSVCKYTMLASV